MDCDRLREVLVEHVDGLLGAGEAEGARAHLAGCPPCRALQEEVRRGFAALDSWEDETLPDGAYERLLARLPEGPSTPFGAPGVPTPRGRRPWLGRVIRAAVPYAVGAATAAAAVLWFLPGGGSAGPGGVPAERGPGDRSPAPVAVSPSPGVPARAGAAVAGAGSVPRLRPALREGETRLQFRNRPVQVPDFDQGVVRTVSLPEGLDPGKVMLVDDRRPVVEPDGVR